MQPPLIKGLTNQLVEWKAMSWRERSRVQRVLARQARRKANRKGNTTAKCSYHDCQHAGEPLFPCENPGLCPRFTHAKCSQGDGDKLLCSVCVGHQQCSRSQRNKRNHDKTPEDVVSTTRSVSKSRRISRDDATRVDLFGAAEDINDPSIGIINESETDEIVNESESEIINRATFTVPMIPETPQNQHNDDGFDDVTPPSRRRSGGTGPVAAPAYVPGSGQIKDPFQKNYNKDPKRSVDRQFDSEKYNKEQRRKARAVDHFFAVAQQERHRVDGDMTDVSKAEIESVFGNEMPEQKQYKYRGHEKCNILQEILMTLMWYRRAYTFDDLATKWLGGVGDKVLRRAAQNICITWTAFFYSILEVEPLWISPERADMIRPPSFATAVAAKVGHISDCTNTGTLVLREQYIDFIIHTLCV